MALSTASNSVSFHCNACGQCCNSAPLLSVPELFRHEQLFVGCLSLRRIKRHRRGEQLTLADTLYTLTDEDIQQLQALSKTQLFKAGQDGFDYALMAQAIDYPSSQQCPALTADKRCSIHGDQQPAVCRMVPFDALYPDSLQPIVLLNRRFEAECIVAGRHAEFPLVIEQKRIVSPEYLTALNQRRAALQQDKFWWGDAVFAQVQGELGNTALPNADGLLSFSLIPALQVLAGLSAQTQQRCLQYVDSQLALLEGKIAAALLRKSAVDKQTTQLFRGFRNAYLKFRPVLTENPPESNHTLNPAEYLGIVD